MLALIYIEMLAAHIGAQLGSGTLLCFEADGDLWVDNVKIGLVRLSP